MICKVICTKVLNNKFFFNASFSHTFCRTCQPTDYECSILLGGRVGSGRLSYGRQAAPQIFQSPNQDSLSSVHSHHLCFVVAASETLTVFLVMKGSMAMRPSFISNISFLLYFLSMA